MVLQECHSPKFLREAHINLFLRIQWKFENISKSAPKTHLVFLVLHVTYINSGAITTQEQKSPFLLNINIQNQSHKKMPSWIKYFSFSLSTWCDAIKKSKYFNRNQFICRVFEILLFTVPKHVYCIYSKINELSSLHFVFSFFRISFVWKSKWIFWLFHFKQIVQHMNGSVAVSTLTFRPMPADDGTMLKCEGSNPRLPNSALEDSIMLTVMCKLIEKSNS